jgi:hypothetical protein
LLHIAALVEEGGQHVTATAEAANGKANSHHSSGTVAGASMNAVTDDAFVEPLTGTAVLSGVPVSVSPASAT